MYNACETSPYNPSNRKHTPIKLSLQCITSPFMCKLRRQFPRTQSCNGSVQPVSSCKLRQTRVQQQIPCTVQLKSVGALAHGETLSAAILFSSNFPLWDENHNLGKDENDQTLADLTRFVNHGKSNNHVKCITS